MHPAIGAQILRNVSLLQGCGLDVVRHHHERWDGAGYPDGLSGEQIPMSARIFAVADTLDALAYRKKFDATIVGSYAATRWVPDATAVVPPGLDLRDYEPVPPVERERPLIVHAPSDLDKKGTRFVVEACAQLPVELDVVHGVPHDEAVERFKRADIVVDQMHYLWHGVFAIESMAYAKPVVTHLDPDAVRQTEEAFGVKVPIVAATKDDLVEKLRPLVESFELRKRLGQEGRAYVERVHDLDKVADRLIQIYASIL